MKTLLCAKLSCLVVAASFVAACAGNEVVKPDTIAAPAAVQSKAPVQGSKVASAPVPATQGAVAAPVKGVVADAGIGSGAGSKTAGRGEAAGKGDSIGRLETIYFDFDSHVLSKNAREQLAKNFEQLSRSKSIRIAIEGHCDERGSGEYNLALGERRAKSAMQYLATMGIPADRLTVISYGSERPAAAGHEEAAWDRNRRDEFTLVRK